MLNTPRTAESATWHKTDVGQYALRYLDGSPTGATVEYSGGIWRVYVHGRQEGRQHSIGEAKGLARSLV